MKFSSVIGQEGPKNRLIHGVKTNRVAHAQLILGSEGSGNLALALAYIQYLLCKQKTDNDSCGECGTCRKVSALVHPDVHFTFPFPKKKDEIEQCSDAYPQWREACIDDPYLNYGDWMQQMNAENKQGNIPSKELRSIIKKVSLKSFEGGMKICLIWLPEYMGQEGNILLKLLEEPPDQTLFLLVGENADDILSTIISRTQLMRIAPILDSDMALALIEREGLSGEDAGRLARVAQGNYRLARELAKEATSPHLDAWRQWMSICFKRKMVEAFQWSDDTATMGREGIKSFLLYGIQVLRTCAIIPHKGAEGLWAGPELDFVVKFNTLNIGFTKIEAMVEVLESCMDEIERNGNAKVILMDASYAMVRAIMKK